MGVPLPPGLKLCASLPSVNEMFPICKAWLCIVFVQDYVLYLSRIGKYVDPVTSRPALKKVNFQELKIHFISMQEKHRAARRQPRSADQLTTRFNQL